MSRPPQQGKLVAEALTAPMTQAQLAKAAGVGQAVVSRTLARMMQAYPKEVHISGWQPARASGPPVAIYSPGDGEDVRCTIPTLSGAQRVARCRTRKRMSMQTNRDTWSMLSSALFGGL